MRQFLNPQIHAAAVDADLVLLDVNADAYLCLPGAAESWNGGAGAKALLDDLVEKGLATRSPAPEPAPSVLELPRIDLRNGQRRQPTAADLLHLAGAWLDLALHYRGRSLSHILAAVRRRQSSPREASDIAELQRLCQVFATAVVWLPAPGKCLVRSFLLIRFLQRAGQDARWVFGVRTWPFQAHCWVQSGDAALEDAPERLFAYTPILAV